MERIFIDTIKLITAYIYEFIKILIKNEKKRERERENLIMLKKEYFESDGRRNIFLANRFLLFYFTNFIRTSIQL